MKKRIDTILELQNLREHQLEAAQKLLQEAKHQVFEASNLAIEARDIYIEYASNLNDRIDQLYEECIGKEITHQLIMEKKENEIKMRQKLQELYQKKKEKEADLKKAEDAQRVAHEQVAKERMELEAVKTLVDAERIALNQLELQKEAKMYDDFAICQVAKNKEIV